MEILFVGIIVIYILQKNNKVDTAKFIKDNGNWIKKFKEEDYDFLVRSKYGEDVEPDVLFEKRIQNAFVVAAGLIFIFITQLSFINVAAALVAGYFVFRSGYSNLKTYYKKHLHEINLQLPYFLKNLEVLAQHYTIPVSLAKSIETSPDVFKSGLRKMVARINDGDSSVDPYMDFAKEYPVNDSMRMMRLLYRLGLGSQDRKQDQLITFSKTISSLQNKSRETKYKERLEKMEKKTMTMLVATGAGVMIILVLSILQMFVVM